MMSHGWVMNHALMAPFFAGQSAKKLRTLVIQFNIPSFAYDEDTTF